MKHDIPHRATGPLGAAASIALYDARRSLRDMIVLYIIASPLLLALIARFVLPLVVAPAMSVYLSPDVPAQVSRLLVENGHDISPTPEGSDLMLETEAGTPDRLIVRVSSDRHNSVGLLRAALGGAPRTGQPGQSAEAGLADTVAAFLMLSAAFLAALGSGLSIVEERSAGVHKALSVSPAGIRTYFGGKLLFITVVSVAVSAGASSVLYGLDAPYGRLLLAALAAAPLGLVVALALGLMADSMIAAMGAIKLIMPIFLTVPLVYLFVPTGVRPWFMVFPNVWMLELYRAVFAGTEGTGYALPLVATAVAGCALIVPVALIARKKLGLKI